MSITLLPRAARGPAPMLALSLAAAPAFAHDGHGMPGDSHWHASDTLGWALLIVVLVGGAWFMNRRK
jgi:hypothetical protein